MNHSNHFDPEEVSMTDSPPALPGHHDLLALINALGNGDTEGARALLDQLSVEELKAAAFYAAETFAMNSPNRFPNYVQREIFRVAAGSVGWFPAHLEQHVTGPEKALRKAIASGDPARIAKKATALDIAVRAFIGASELYVNGIRALAEAEEGSNAERR